MINAEIKRRLSNIEKILWSGLPNSINSPSDELILDALREIYFVLELQATPEGEEKSE